MKASSNLREIVPGLWCWSSYHEEWKVDFSCCAWKSGGDLVLIDPVRLEDSNLARLDDIGRPTVILLTNQNHERDADWFRKHYGIPVCAHRDAVPGIEITPDDFFCDGATWAGGLRAIHVPGTTPCATVFHTGASGGILIAGDIVIQGKQGLEFLPDSYCKDVHQSRISANKLLSLEFDTLVTAHGAPVHPGAKAIFAELFHR